MKLISLKEVYSDSRGKIQSIITGIPFRELNKFTSKKGAVRGNHYHKESVELIYVLTGKVQVHIRNVKTNEEQDFTMGADEALIVDPYESHQVTILEDSSWINALTKEYDKENPDICN